MGYAVVQLAKELHYKPDSIPDGVTGIFYLHNPSGRTMALGFTRPLKEMSTRDISWGGKGGRCVGLTNLITFMCRLS